MTPNADEVQPSPATVDGGATVQEAPEVTTIGGKPKKSDKTGNLIMDIAHEVEQMSKTKALNEAAKLAENVEVTYFKLGGVLKVINDNNWFEGFQTFDDFVTEKYGFQGRKARYLIMIYDNLVTKQIPWDKVADLGWTKLKDLAPRLTLENVDEWVEKAKNLTVKELQALLQSEEHKGEDETVKTSDPVVKIKFNLKPDQADIVQQALAKAKGELHTEYDTVALEGICFGYVGGNSAVGQSMPTIEQVMEHYGFEGLMNQVAALKPEYDIEIKQAGAAE